MIPFITAGDPTPEAILPLMHALAKAGADVIELGVPFSDPMADGPTIQRASERALARGMNLRRWNHPELTVFGNLARNTRVPTVIELGCADPDQPCRLPAGLQSDPYLKQVQSETFELGARGTWGANLEWNATAYRTDLQDDIFNRPRHREPHPFA